MTANSTNFLTWAKNEQARVRGQREDLLAKINAFLIKANMLMGELNGRHDLLTELIAVAEKVKSPNGVVHDAELSHAD